MSSFPLLLVMVLAVGVGNVVVIFSLLLVVKLYPGRARALKHAVFREDFRQATFDSRPFAPLLCPYGSLRSSTAGATTIVP